MLLLHLCLDYFTTASTESKLVNTGASGGVFGKSSNIFTSFTAEKKAEETLETDEDVRKSRTGYIEQEQFRVLCLFERDDLLTRDGT